MTLLFAATAGLCVANVYYAQPLLDLMAAEFGLPSSAAGGIVTATQLGSAVSLIFLLPLGDMLDRRRLLLWQLGALGAACVAMASVRGLPWLLAGAAAVGLFGTAMTQGLIACAAAQADDRTRGSVVGTVQGGVVLGMLLSRAVAGVIGEHFGWQAVYAASAAVSAIVFAALWRWLPPEPPGRRAAGAAVATGRTPGRRYASLLASMPRLLLEDRVLQQRGMLALLMFAVLNVLWSALVLPLSAPPYELSHTVIGMFGLAGAAGALGAAHAGRLADSGHAQRVTGVALILLIASWAPLSQADGRLWPLLLGIVVLDLGGQAIHVSNQSLIFRRGGTAHGRLVACYMLFYATGSGLGALAATAAYAAGGWQAVCLLGAALSIAALLFWAATPKRSP